jgi:ribonuclease BN (tRNA processing enzyme)
VTIKVTTIGWWGAYPNANEATSGYLVQSEGLNILVDCGSGVLSHLQNYIELQHLDAVVLSHYHWDHVADIGCLQYAARILMDLGQRQDPLAIYGHAEDDNLGGLDYLQYSKGYAIDPRMPLQLNPLTFSFCRNVHPDPCYSIRIDQDTRCLVYIADTAWTDDLIAIARGADLLICESSLYDEYRGKIPGHLTAGEAGQIAASAGAKHLVLTHLPHFGDHTRLLKQAAVQFGGKIELAATGKVWLL